MTKRKISFSICSFIFVYKVKAFETLRLRAELYYAYSFIYADSHEPFSSAPPEQILECGLFLLNELSRPQSAASTKSLVHEAGRSACKWGSNKEPMSSDIYSFSYRKRTHALQFYCDSSSLYKK